MSEKKIERKIAVIFAADVVGYSKHMKNAEVNTLKSFKSCKKILDRLFEEHGGLIFNTAGDSILAEFSSAVSAVVCASEFQKLIKERNSSGDAEVQMEFRIGINMGDVVKESGNLYGDGVNIAARLEALAQHGGVCISKSVYDFVNNKTNILFSDLGKQKVKDEEFHAYDIILEQGQKRRIKSPSKYKLPILASIFLGFIIAIAVFINFGFENGPAKKENLVDSKNNEKVLGKTLLIVPFENKGNSVEFDSIAQGITDQLVSSLPSTILLNIVPRQQSYSIAEENYSPDQLRKKFGISFVLDGSISVSGEKFRVNFELLDLGANKIIWSNNEEFFLNDIFGAQDEIEFIVRRNLQSKLTMGEVYSSSLITYFPDREEYKNVLSLRVNTFEENFSVAKNFDEPYRLLAERNPENSYAHYLYASALWRRLLAGKLDFADYQKMHKIALKAQNLEPNNSAVYPLLGAIQAFAVGENILKAEQTVRKGIALGEENYETIRWAASILSPLGKIEDSIAYFKKAMVLAPYGPQDIYWSLARAYFLKNQLNEVEELSNIMMSQPEEHLVFWGGLFLIYKTSLDDNIAEAKKSIREFLKKRDLSIKETLEKIDTSPFANLTDPFVIELKYHIMLAYDPYALEELNKIAGVETYVYDPEKEIFNKYVQN